MQKLLSAILPRLEAGERVELCMILRSEGSSPRGAGTAMAVFADGTSAGTVGGGALELSAGQQAAVLLAQGQSDVKDYHLYPAPADALGMVCGGSVRLGFACLDAEAIPLLSDLAQALAAAEPVWLELVIRAEGSSSLRLLREDGLHSEAPRLPRQLRLTETAEQTELLLPMQTGENAYIIGGGHVGEALVPVLAAVGFSVTLYDARPNIALPERFPAAKRVVLGPFDQVDSRLQIGSGDYVVIVTPGHAADYEVLSRVLRSGAAYIGCIGSRKKVAYVNGRLREAGFTEEEIARIHAPIGLPILAQTPEEIAVSIAAEMILHRHGGN